MPPKQTKSDKGQQKAQEKAKVKAAEDLTFGLKNKNKSKSVQKYVKSVQQAAVAKGGKMKSEQQLISEEHEKKAAQRQAQMLASLMKGTEKMKAVESAKKLDPKQIREDQQIDIYQDQRAQRKQEETMDDWDQAKLELVVRTKHGGQLPTCDIVCKYFLDALEKRLYGWFWQCPNGDGCQYKHCLPPGYVIKKKEPVGEVEDDEEPIEELVERERAALPAGGTPVTLETFLAWKQRRKEEKEHAAAAEKKRLAEAVKAGKAAAQAGMSGRALFAFDPSLFVDDMAAIEQVDYEEDEAYWAEQLAAEDAAAEAARTMQHLENIGCEDAEAEPEDQSTDSVDEGKIVDQEAA